MLRVLCTALSTETGPHHQILKDAGCDVVVADRSLNLYTTDGLLRASEQIDAVIAGSEPWPRTVIEQRPRIRVLSRTGVGFDAIDLAACDERRVVVATTPGVNHHAVAEHTLSLMLGLSRGFPRRDQTVRSGVWERPSTPRLMGRTLGVLGLGRIGQAVVEKVAGLGMTVLGYDPYPNAAFVQKTGIKLVSLTELLAASDYVTLHLPVMPETTKLINAQTIAQMKPEAVLINTARGALVDEPALIAALQSGRLRGAGLDVFAVEPLPADSPLLSMSNVLLSGHIAGLDHESQFDTLTMAADTILQLQRGSWPADRIQNLKGTTGWTW
jgi:D-3-phosphoglycerate dehydrogenase / 2-oxoglutarate reductase